MANFSNTIRIDGLSTSSVSGYRNKYLKLQKGMQEASGNASEHYGFNISLDI